MKKLRACSNCPFRTDKAFYLHPVRRQEIANTLLNDQVFLCHKQLKLPVADRRPCVGSAIVLDKEQGVMSNLAYRLHIRFNGFSDNYDESVPVFNSLQEFIDGN
jgi:hypothetical protein